MCTGHENAYTIGLCDPETNQPSLEQALNVVFNNYGNEKQVEMKPEDLRVGNLIQYANEESNKVVTVDVDMLSYLERYKKNPYDDEFSRGMWYQPIPLNEQWLINFGFKMTNDPPEGYGKYYRHIPSGLVAKVWKDNTPNKEVRGKVVFEDINGGIKLTHIKYVHQLQNMHHSVNGKELVIVMVEENEKQVES